MVAKKYAKGKAKKKRKATYSPVQYKGLPLNPLPPPVDVVFRVTLKTGEVKVTDEHGNLLDGELLTPELIANYEMEIDTAPLIFTVTLPKCNKETGCTVKYVGGQPIVYW